ncbi:leucine-rich repeat extensin-like protein 5 [Myzus persicae]|uniref:leucine-rich repeat extensin-like protein 5 n=1 Tax=Myzus persicae TaxID=13164 RepID=UPI000B938D38|nr:leucine-rich repeat extensin-like protein 5 [Myzus persicae]
MNAQICLMLATSCLAMVSANSGSYNYGYSLNDPITGELQEQREAKACNDQVVYDDVKPVIVSKSFVSEPIISVTPGPILNAEYVSSSPAPILRSDFDSSRIVAAAPLLETKIEAEPVIYAPRPEYAPLPKYAAPITVTAAPILEAKIAAEPLIYAPRPEYTPLPKFASPITVTAAPILEAKIAAEPLIYAPRPEYTPIPKYAALQKYAPRPEYFAASPAPQVASRLSTPIVQVQAAPSKIIKSAQLVSYGRQASSYSHKSFVNHPQTPAKVAAIAAPQYYSAAPAAPSYYAAAPAAPEYYSSPAPAAPEYYAPAPAAPEYYAPAPAAPIALKMAYPVQVRANAPLQQAAAGLVYAPSAQYAYRSSSSPATSYQYAKHWNSGEQSAAGQLRYVAASPQYYSTVYQPQLDSVTQVHNSGQYDAAQEQPCDK